VQTPEEIEEVESMQLWRDKELNDGRDEKKRYQTILQTIRQIIHTDIQMISKNRSISGEDKQEILSLKKKTEELI
jgi:hypothetical protein